MENVSQNAMPRKYMPGCTIQSIGHIPEVPFSLSDFKLILYATVLSPQPCVK